MIEENKNATALVEIHSVAHDVMSPRHDRDFRTISLFLLDEMRRLNAQAVGIVEIKEDSSTQIVHNFQISEVDDECNPL